jgi:hypothetical protein
MRKIIYSNKIAYEMSIKKPQIETSVQVKKLKIPLVENPSIKHLYKVRLGHCLKGKTGGMDNEWVLTKYTLTTKAIEVLGLQNKRKRRSLKI